MARANDWCAEAAAARRAAGCGIAVVDDADVPPGWAGLVRSLPRLRPSHGRGAGAARARRSVAILGRTSKGAEASDASSEPTVPAAAVRVAGHRARSRRRRAGARARLPRGGRRRQHRQCTARGHTRSAFGLFGGGSRPLARTAARRGARRRNRGGAPLLAAGRSARAPPSPRGPATTTARRRCGGGAWRARRGGGGAGALLGSRRRPRARRRAARPRSFARGGRRCTRRRRRRRRRRRP